MATLARLDVLLAMDTKKFQKSLKKTEWQLRKTGDFMKGVGMSMTQGFTIPLGIAAVAAGKMAAEFDYSMSKVHALVGVSTSQVEKWKDSVLDLSRVTGVVPKELAEGMYFVTSAGLRGARALEALEYSAMAAASGLGETATIADTVTSSMNAYAQSGLSAEEATSSLLMAIREGKAYAEDMAPAMGKLLPIAAELGISFEEVGAGMAALTRTGAPAAEAATGLRMIMLALIKPTSQSSVALQSLGINLADLRKQVDQGGLFSALMELRGHFEGNIEATAAVFSRVRALTSVLALTGENAGDVAKIFERMEESSGALSEAFKYMKDRPLRQLKQEFSKFQATMIELGNQALPPLLTGLKALNVVLVSIGAVLSSMPGWMTGFIVSAAAVGPLAVAFGWLATVTRYTTQSVRYLGTKLLGFGTILGAGSAKTKTLGNTLKVLGGRLFSITRGFLQVTPISSAFFAGIAVGNIIRAIPFVKELEKEIRTVDYAFLSVADAQEHAMETFAADDEMREIVRLTKETAKAFEGMNMALSVTEEGYIEAYRGAQKFQALIKKWAEERAAKKLREDFIKNGTALDRLAKSFREGLRDAKAFASQTGLIVKNEAFEKLNQLGFKFAGLRQIGVDTGMAFDGMSSEIIDALSATLKYGTDIPQSFLDAAEAIKKVTPIVDQLTKKTAEHLGLWSRLDISEKAEEWAANVQLMGSTGDYSAEEIYRLKDSIEEVYNRAESYGGRKILSKEFLEIYDAIMSQTGPITAIDSLMRKYERELPRATAAGQAALEEIAWEGTIGRGIQKAREKVSEEILTMQSMLRAFAAEEHHTKMIIDVDSADFDKYIMGLGLTLPDFADEGGRL